MCVVLSHVQLFGTPWAVDCQAHLSMEFFQAIILEQVAVSCFRGSSWPRDGTSISCISCVGRWTLYHCTTWEAPCMMCLSQITTLFILNLHGALCQLYLNKTGEKKVALRVRFLSGPVALGKLLTFQAPICCIRMIAVPTLEG